MTVKSSPVPTFLAIAGIRLGLAVIYECYLVDPASSHMLVSKIKPCMFAPKPSGRGTPAWVSQIAAPILSRIWDGSWSPCVTARRWPKSELRAPGAPRHAVVNSSLVISPVAPVRKLDDPKSSTRPQSEKRPQRRTGPKFPGKGRQRGGWGRDAPRSDANGAIRPPIDSVVDRRGLRRWPKPGFVTPARRRCLNRGLQHALTACLASACSGDGLWAPHSTRLETRTKESDMCASQRVSKPVRRFECEHACRDPKDGELCLSGAKPEETLVEARSDTDVQIVRLTWRHRGRNALDLLPSHGIESSKWAIFGKQNWRCGMNRKPGYGAQLRANLEPTKGVGRLRQQDGGHGSRNPLRIDPKSRGNRLIALMRANFKGDPVKIPNRGVAVGGSVRESGDAGGIRKELSFLFNSLPTLKRLSRRQGKSAKWIRNREKDWLEGWAQDPSSNPSTVGGLLELLTRRERTSRVGRGRTGNSSREFLRRRTANSELCSECQSEEILPSAAKPQPRNGLGRISGKEDPVELDSMRIRTVKAWPIDPLDLEFEARGVRKVTTGITGLWQPSVHSGVAFDPSMSALPIIVKQNSPSVGLFTHQ
ncbi:hypothetical protein Bca4012_102590 [Brassica carinata]